MKVIVIAGRKGGIGKTSTTVLLGGESLDLGVKPILMDGDPNEGTLTWAASQSAGVLKALVRTIDSQSPEEFKAYIDAAAQFADVLIIDTPPGSTEPDYSLWAIMAADAVVFPVGPDRGELNSQKEFIEAVCNLNREAGLNLKLYTSFNRGENDNETKEVRKGLLKVNEEFNLTGLPEIPKATIVRGVKNEGLTMLECINNRSVKKIRAAASQATIQIFKDLGVPFDV